MGAKIHTFYIDACEIQARLDQQGRYSGQAAPDIALFLQGALVLHP